MSLRIITLCLFFHFIRMVVSASPTDPDTLSKLLNEVTIVASRSETDLNGLPRSVTILTRKELQALPYLSLGNLLEEQAGLYLIGTGQAPGSNQTIFLRGGNTNQTAVFVDGVRIQDVSTVNGVADLTELPLQSIDRVEILRGAQGTLYGSPAAAGVILITTDKVSKKPFGGTAGFQSGSYQKGGIVLGMNASVGGSFGKGFYYRGDASLFGSTGFNATTDTAVGNPDDDDFHKRNFHGSAGYRSNDYDVEFNFRRTEMKTEIDRQAYVDDDNYTLDFQRDLFGFHFGHRFSDLFNMSLSASVTSTRRESVNDSSLTADGIHYDRSFTSESFSGKQIASELLATYIVKSCTLVGGLNMLQESMSQDNYYYNASFDPYIYEATYNLDTINPFARTIGGYMHATIPGASLSEKLSRFNFLGGARIQHHSLCGTNASFDISTALEVDDELFVYASFSDGFTTPSLYQQFAPDRYFPFDLSSSSDVTLGFKGLNTESVNSWEIGIKESSPGEWNWRIAAFRNVTQRLIDYVYLWNGEVPESELMTDPNRDDYRGATYANIGDQTIYGIEFEFMRRFGKKWQAELSGCMVDGQLDYDGGTAISGRLRGLQVQLFTNGEFLDAPRKIDALVRRPGTIKAALHFSPIETLDIRWQTRYVGGRNDVYYDGNILPFGALGRVPLKGYSLSDLSFVWAPSAAIKLQLQVENLFSLEYQEIQGFATRRRGFLIGLLGRF